MRHVLVLVLLAGCGGDADVGADAAPCDPVALEGETFTGPDGSVLAIVATDPSPPARFTNAWTVTIDDPAGGPIDPAILAVSAFMPAHGHGSPIAPTIAEVTDGISVAPLDLWMPGRWEVRFDVATERIVVPVCVPQ